MAAAEECGNILVGRRISAATQQQRRRHSGSLLRSEGAAVMNHATPPTILKGSFRDEGGELQRAVPALGKHAQLPSAAVTSFLSARGAYDRSFRTARKCRKLVSVCISVSERLSSRQRFSLLSIKLRFLVSSWRGSSTMERTQLVSLLPPKRSSLPFPSSTGAYIGTLL